MKKSKNEDEEIQILSKNELKEMKKESLERLNDFLKDHEDLKKDFRIIMKRSSRSSNNLKKSNQMIIDLIKDLKKENLDSIEIFKRYKKDDHSMRDISRLIMIRYHKYISFKDDIYSISDEKSDNFHLESSKDEFNEYDQSQIL